MKGDFSRITFDAAHHFSRVLMQQGRVTLDADPNEQADILLHYLRTLARDLIGPYGGPADALGFQLTVPPPGSSSRWTLNIGPGRYYVEGILCENTETCSYADQPDYTPGSDDVLLLEIGKSAPSKSYWLYLDVWERHITPIEDDRVREAALGGPDTCTRTKVIWQVKAVESAATTGDPCTAQLATLTRLSSGQMAAELDPGQRIQDPCVIAPDARYRGAENQLYRVEIHRGGSIAMAEGKAVEATGRPTFKWSRDNGSVATAWLGIEGNDLVVASARGFAAGNWVELSDDDHDLRGEPGVLVKLSSVDGNRLRVDAGTSLPGRPSDGKKPKVRRWDQTGNDDLTLADGAISLTDGDKQGWIDLEDGVRVQFGAGDYRTGDYWLIPARVATGDIEWPRSDAKADFVPPRGVEHHYAPLGRLSWNGSAWNVDSCLRTLKAFAAPDAAAPAKPPSAAPTPPPPPASAPGPTQTVAGASKEARPLGRAGGE